MTGIYMITNKINGKRYIGQTLNFYHRYCNHKWSIKKLDTVLTRAFKKYGFENFEFEMIQECKPTELGRLEIHYVEKFNPEYNMVGGGGGVPGMRLSEETKKRLSIKAKKQWAALTGIERLVKIKTNLTGPTAGKPRSVETKEKLRKIALEQFKDGMPEETKKKIGESNRVVMKGNTNRKRAVAQLDCQENEIKRFEMVKDAAECVGRNAIQITKACDGRSKTCAGYRWKYCD